MIEFKQCPKCKKTYFKPLAFGKRKRICKHCEGEPCAAKALEDVK